jgi:predicted MFS family arabinose efflux permease
LPGPICDDRAVLRAVFLAYRDAFTGLPRGPWVLAAVCFVHRSGTMVLPFLALYLTAQRGFSAGEAGLVLALYGVGSGAGAFVGGQLTDRWGAHRVQATSLVLAGVGLYGLGQLESQGAIRLAMPFVAMAAEAFRPANSTAFAQQAPPERWSQAFALRRLAINLGMTCGPALGGLLAAHDYHLLFLVDGVTCVLAAGLLLAAGRGRDVPAVRPSRPAADVIPAPRLSPWTDGPFLALLAMTLAVNVVFMQLLSTYPLALRDLHGFTEPMTGSVFAINTILIVLFEMVLVRRLSTGRPLGIARWGALLLCFGFALLPFGSGYTFVALTVVVWTAGEMTTMPFFETVSASRGDDSSRGRYLGAYNLAFALAFGLAPLIGTMLYERLGSVAFWAGCGALGIAVWALLPGVERRLAAPRRQRGLATV